MDAAEILQTRHFSGVTPLYAHKTVLTLSERHSTNSPEETAQRYAFTLALSQAVRCRSRTAYSSTGRSLKETVKIEADVK